MKMFELAATKPSKEAAKVFESYFGDSINVDVISPRQARTMLNKVQKLVTEHRSTPAFHHSEKNPTYLKLMMLERVLRAKVKETATAVAGGADASQPAAPGTPPAAPGAAVPGAAPGAAAPNAALANAATNAATQAAAKAKELQTIKTKATQGQPLTPAEQQELAETAIRTESKAIRRQLYRLLRESEVKQAQVVVAAQAMVGDLQTMLEEVSSMQFKDLPGLVDEIKNQIGVDQAMQFNTDAVSALSGLVQGIQAAKNAMDQALSVVTGQQPSEIPGQEPELGAEPGLDAQPDMGAEPGMDAEPDLDAEPSLDDEEPDMDGAGLGRAKR
jgi:hypothetical protein